MGLKCVRFDQAAVFLGSNMPIAQVWYAQIAINSVAKNCWMKVSVMAL
jgi:hypothetical protein